MQSMWPITSGELFPGDTLISFDQSHANIRYPKHFSLPNKKKGRPGACTGEGLMPVILFNRGSRSNSTVRGCRGRQAKEQRGEQQEHAAGSFCRCFGSSTEPNESRLLFAVPSEVLWRKWVSPCTSLHHTSDGIPWSRLPSMPRDYGRDHLAGRVQFFRETKTSSAWVYSLVQRNNCAGPYLLLPVPEKAVLPSRFATILPTVILRHPASQYLDTQT
jgi:hypothetical protein